MENEEFEAYAYTGYDWENDDYTEDYPHKILAHVNGQIETWEITGVVGSRRYRKASTEPYTSEKWIERTNDETDSAIEDLDRYMFDHYTTMGLLCG